jgi:hypothetical protein
MGLLSWIKGLIAPQTEDSFVLIRKDRMSWDHDPETNRLYLRGESFKGHGSLGLLEEHLKRMLEIIEQSGEPVTIEAVAIEENIAFGLWWNGDFELEDLRASTTTRDYIEFMLPLLGEPTKVRIYPALYYLDYGFIVSGHPQGYRLIRDVPDFLALMPDENGKIEEAHGLTPAVG